MRRESHVRFCEGGGVRLPSATRLVRSIKEECLDHLLVLGERHLQRVIVEFVAHYHAERNHQGLDNELIQPLRPPAPSGAVRRRPRMGGMLNCYESSRDFTSARAAVLTREQHRLSTTPGIRRGSQC